MDSIDNTKKDMTAQQWQTLFRQSLFDGLSKSLAETLTTEEKHQQQRFAIYQNNVFYSLSQALGDLYPVIKKLVGDDFFNGTASVYIRQHPPSRAAMVYFGEQFPHFLANFEHTQAMPYLADIAQLELARHKAYHAADDVVLTPADFEAIDAIKFEHSKVKLHPSVNMVDSNFPVFQIWQANHHNIDNEDDIHLDEPESAIIVRYNYECQVFNVDRGTYRFYDALSQYMTISESASYAYESKVDRRHINEKNTFDISSAIALGIQNGFFSQLIFQ